MGYVSYQRSVPKDVEGHPVFKGKKLWRVPLGLKVGTDEEVIYLARMEKHNEFETLLVNLRKTNQPLLKARELEKKAQKLLKVYGLDAGERSPNPLLTDEQNRNIQEAIDFDIDHKGMLDEATDFYNKRDSGEIDVNESIPSHVQVTDEAWKLLNLPKSESKTQAILLSDCWGIYEKENNLDLQNRQVKKTYHRWNHFLDFAGDCIVTQDEIHDQLKRYVAHRQECRNIAVKSGKKPSPNSATIKKEVDYVCAIINVATASRPIRIKKPKIVETDLTIRETLTPQEILEIVELAQNTHSAYYKSWKELAILIMAQTSCIASELQRMEKNSTFLDADIPVIKVMGKVKTKNRLRTIPLVYKVDRIRELINTIAPESKYILGAVADKTESNISKQLKNIIEKINPQATAYSFRHAFKNNAMTNDIDYQDIAYLGGWSGSTFRVNEVMMNYGRKGFDTIEMAIKLQRVMMRINRQLLQSESTGNNVIRLPA
jgi:hypothetical protein